MDKRKNWGIFIIIIFFIMCEKSPTSKQEYIDIESVNSQIIDLTRYKNKILLIDSSFTTYEYVDDGKLILLKENSPKYFYDLKTNTSVSEDFNFNKYSYLCNSEDCYFSCISDLGWSSCFVKLAKNTYEEEFFHYINGIPSGLFYCNEHLYYLGGTGIGEIGSHSYLTCFDTNTSEIVYSVEMDYLCGKGLYTDGEIFMSFDRNTKNIFSFFIEDSTYEVIAIDDNS